eukprot:TCONS_00047911-protein
MDEQSCPRCKSTSYRNNKLKLLVNVCGHKLCSTCVDVLFTRPSAACPQCNTALRRSDFRVQQFEDALVEKEVDIRRKIVKIFNKREEDFKTLLDYNNYLEDIEVIIFNLANKQNVDETKKKVDAYKKDNEKLIRRNNTKISQEEALMKASIEADLQSAETKRKMLVEEVENAALQKKKEKENLINDLIYANAPAEEVIARHKLIKEQHQQQKMEEEEQKKSFFFSEKNKNSHFVNQPIVEAPLFIYQESTREWFGPSPPEEDALQSKGYLQHIRSASSSERAGGYTESIACQRAIQEAFDCLFI